MSCDCGNQEHKVWCAVCAERRKKRAAERPPPKRTAAQKRQAEHAELMSRRVRVKAL